MLKVVRDVESATMTGSAVVVLSGDEQQESLLSSTPERRRGEVANLRILVEEADRNAQGGDVVLAGK